MPPTPPGLPTLSPLILGGAGFSSQLTSTPHSLPAVPILLRAFSLGLLTIDTSPYYHPSEEILGAALQDPAITSRYRREDYVLMTKAGRIAADHFDYSPAWIRTSVERSLGRFGTGYLDVVFCHDVEYISLEEGVGAVGTLLELKDQGVIRAAGISGYDLPKIKAVAKEVQRRYGRGVDVVQNWAQLTLQNTRLETEGLRELREAGVWAVCASSPLACGLLRDGGVPVGALGDWHPAPEGLRERSREAARVVRESGESLPGVALRFAIRRAVENTKGDLVVSTITGIGSLEDLEENAAAARQVLGDGILGDAGAAAKKAGEVEGGDKRLQEKDEVLFKKVREVLGDWIDYDFSTPKDAET